MCGAQSRGVTQRASVWPVVQQGRIHDASRELLTGRWHLAAGVREQAPFSTRQPRAQRAQGLGSLGSMGRPLSCARNRDIDGSGL
jgi:hypothetical protein